MSDAVWLAVIGLLTFVIKDLLDRSRSKKVNQKIDDNASQMNGHLASLVKAKEDVAQAEGKEAGVAQEQERVAGLHSQTIIDANDLIENAKEAAVLVADTVSDAAVKAAKVLHDAADHSSEKLEDRFQQMMKQLQQRQSPGNQV